MSGHRRTAVVLHGLQAQDRAWMLAELPEPDQAIVRAHLTELDALGFSLGSEMIAELNLTGLNHSAATLDSAQRLQQASAQQIVALLEHEPSALSARFFSLQAWPWQEAVWAHLAAPLRQRIRSSMPTTPAAMLDQFLIDTLASRLQALPSVEPKPAPAPAWWKMAWRAAKWNR